MSTTLKIRAWHRIKGLTCKCLLANVVMAGVGEAQRDRVLFLTESVGYRHAVVTRERPEEPSLAERILKEHLAPILDVECTQDCSRLSAANLKNYRAVVFYTNGDLPVPEAERLAFLEWIRNGGAFVGIHSATGAWRTWTPYTEMIGALFWSHPWTQQVRLRVEDSGHPATAHLKDSFPIHDEIYQFKAFDRKKTHVLLSLDGASADLAKGGREDKDYALAWCHDYGKGRVFYTALGHRPEVWQDKHFLQHVTGGLCWTLDSHAVNAGRGPPGPGSPGDDPGTPVNPHSYWLHVEVRTSALEQGFFVLPPAWTIRLSNLVRGFTGQKDREWHALDIFVDGGSEPERISVVHDGHPLHRNVLRSDFEFVIDGSPVLPRIEAASGDLRNLWTRPLP